MKTFLCILVTTVLIQADIDWTKIKPRNIYVPVNSFGPFFNENGRIVGGQEAMPHQFPWQAALNINKISGSSFCGGTLISNNYVLTAAHCLEKAKTVEIILGAHKYSQSEPTQIRLTSGEFTIHKEYIADTNRNDIALIKLPQPVELTESIKLATLPSKNDVTNNFSGIKGTTSGWGLTKDNGIITSSVLNYVEAKIIPNWECLLAYPFYIRSTHICISGFGGKGFCNGDSGGPLTVTVAGETKLVGVVSFYKLKCSWSIPQVFTRVTSYLDWIQEYSDVIIN